MKGRCPRPLDDRVFSLKRGADYSGELSDLQGVSQLLKIGSSVLDHLWCHDALAVRRHLSLRPHCGGFDVDEHVGDFGDARTDGVLYFVGDAVSLAHAHFRVHADVEIHV